MRSFDTSVRIFGELIHRRPLECIKIAWWWITRRRVRARNRFRAALADLPDVYRTWLWLNERRPQEGLPSSTGMRFAVHVHIAPQKEKAALAAVRSVVQQLGEQDRLYVSAAQSLPAQMLHDIAKASRTHVISEVLVTRSKALRHVMNMAAADYLLPLDAAATFVPGSLDRLAKAIQVHGKNPCVFYADQDERDLHGKRTQPWFKPKWDHDLFLAQDFMSDACAIPIDIAKLVEMDDDWPDDVAVYALLERLQKGAGHVPHHVPLIMVSVARDTWKRVSKARMEIVRAASGCPVKNGSFGTLIVQRPLPQPAPLVSVIVPTRDRLDLLEPCVWGVLQGTTYPNIELLIADNGSVEPATLTFFEKMRRHSRVKIVEWPHAYNYSAINNFAVTRSNGDYVCLLNNDTEVIAGDWLSQMMAHAVRPDVGAVGARLLYSDHSIQHAGIVVGMGNAAGHAHRGLPEGDPGYFAQALITRQATAVTGACLVVARKKFNAVGGLDEADLAIAYNDVDLCLKLHAAGWRNIYAPEAVLIHHESKSRGMDFAPEHLARYMRELRVFQSRWGTIGYRDTTHHSALDASSEIYRLKL